MARVMMTGSTMAELAGAFPSVARAPGAVPWEPLTFLRWLCGPAPGSGATHAGRLLLGLWNRSLEWGAVAQAEGLGDCHELVAPFRLHEALAVWDSHHVATLAAWMGVPGVVRHSPLVADREALREAHGEGHVTEEDAHGEVSGPAWLVEGLRLELREQRAEARRWPSSGPQAMVELGGLFPSLSEAPGAAPWRVESFVRWLAHPSREPAALCAGRFLLDVWNSREDWVETARSAGAHTPALASRFDLLEALEAWDEAHLQAAVAFMAVPFWP